MRATIVKTRRLVVRFDERDARAWRGQDEVDRESHARMLAAGFSRDGDRYPIVRTRVDHGGDRFVIIAMQTRPVRITR